MDTEPSVASTTSTSLSLLVTTSFPFHVRLPDEFPTRLTLPAGISKALTCSDPLSSQTFFTGSVGAEDPMYTPESPVAPVGPVSPCTPCGMPRASTPVAGVKDAVA